MSQLRETQEVYIFFTKQQLGFVNTDNLHIVAKERNDQEIIAFWLNSRERLGFKVKPKGRHYKQP